MMTPAKWLLLPAFLHFSLVMAVGARLARARFAAGRAGLIDRKKIALDNSAWPENVRKLSNNYANQFELPVLFYAVIAFQVATGIVDGVAIALAFAFVATRLVHTIIHTGGNPVRLRFRAFFAGLLCIVLMWTWFAVRLYVTG
jgi:hypothetical protein